MENMKKKGTYEKHKMMMRKRYHEKIKNNYEEMNKRNIYYKNWYSKNKYKVQEKRKNTLYNYKKKEIIPAPIVKITKKHFILRFD